MRIFSLLALLLYIAPMAFRNAIPARAQTWLRGGAIALLTAGIAIALVESVRWFAQR